MKDKKFIVATPGHLPVIPIYIEKNTMTKKDDYVAPQPLLNPVGKPTYRLTVTQNTGGTLVIEQEDPHTLLCMAAQTVGNMPGGSVVGMTLIQTRVRPGIVDHFERTQETINLIGYTDAMYFLEIIDTHPDYEKFRSYSRFAQMRRGLEKMEGLGLSAGIKVLRNYALAYANLNCLISNEDLLRFINFECIPAMFKE